MKRSVAEGRRRRRRAMASRCPHCGTAPARANCGWPCGPFGLVPLASLMGLPSRNVAREEHFRRRGGALWWGRDEARA